MSEKATGTACNITGGEETGQKYVCRFALEGAKGLFFVWDNETPGLELLEDGADVTVTHDGSKYPKVEKIEAAKAQDSKIEKAVKKVEAQDDAAWRIARTSATERVFGNGLIASGLDEELMEKGFKRADEIASYIATGHKPSMK